MDEPHHFIFYFFAFLFFLFFIFHFLYCSRFVFFVIFLMTVGCFFFSFCNFWFFFLLRLVISSETSELTLSFFLILSQKRVDKGSNRTTCRRTDKRNTCLGLTLIFVICCWVSATKSSQTLDPSALSSCRVRTSSKPLNPKKTKKNKLLYLVNA